MALGIGQQIHSAWMLDVGRTYPDDLLISLSPSSAGSVVWNNWWFGVLPGTYNIPRSPGPGISPFSLLQFYPQGGLGAQWSNFIPNIVIPLTGISMTFTPGAISLSFAGQAMAFSTGILTPLISHALSANLWVNAPGTSFAGIGNLIDSAWMLDIENSYPDALQNTLFFPQNLNSASKAVWSNFWFGGVSGNQQGQWVNSHGQANGWVAPGFGLVSMTLTPGTPLPFGVPTASVPAFVQNAGPGVGPFANFQFSPQPFGISFNVNQPLTGSAINSATGVLGLTTVVPVVGTLITSTPGTVTPLQGVLAALVGESIAFNTGTFTFWETDVPLSPLVIQSIPGTMVGGIPPGPGNDLWSTIKGLLEAGLIPQVYYTFSPTIPAGTVISLTPPVGTVVPINSPVVILVSTGPGGAPTTIVMPNLIGLFAKDATDALEANFLSLDKYLWQVNAAPEGTVVAQSIPAGSAVAVASIVQLTLSAGTATVVPPVPVP